MAGNENLMNLFDEIDRAPGQEFHNSSQTQNRNRDSDNFGIIVEGDEDSEQNFNMQSSNEYLSLNRNFASPKMNNFMGGENSKFFVGSQVNSNF